MTTERKRLLRRFYSGTVFVTENTILEGHKLFASQNETTLYGCNDVYDFGGDHLIFRRTKGGSPKTLEGFKGGTTQISLENKDMGGSRK